MKKRKTFALILACFILLIQTSIAQASVYCTDWVQVDITNQRCDQNDGCGFLWQKDTYKYTAWYKRHCSFPTDDGLGSYVKSEIKMENKTGGCCN